MMTPECRQNPQRMLKHFDVGRQSLKSFLGVSWIIGQKRTLIVQKNKDLDIPLGCLSQNPIQSALVMINNRSLEIHLWGHPPATYHNLPLGLLQSFIDSLEIIMPVYQKINVLYTSGRSKTAERVDLRSLKMPDSFFNNIHKSKKDVPVLGIE